MNLDIEVSPAGTECPVVSDIEGIDVTITFDSDQLPCRLHEPDLWFAEQPAELELAKSFCGDCPLRQACLSGALERAEPWGVWGGEILDHGVVIAKKRPRGRPPKPRAVPAPTRREVAA